MDAWCAPHSRSAELTSNTSKTRHQKRSAETGGRNGDSIAEFRTRRPAHICDSSRYRAVFERPSYVTRWRRTGWLGRRDSNLCIRNLSSRWLHCCCACICCHSLRRTIARLAPLSRSFSPDQVTRRSARTEVCRRPGIRSSPARS